MDLKQFSQIWKRFAYLKVLVNFSNILKFENYSWIQKTMFLSVHFFRNINKLKCANKRRKKQTDKENLLTSNKTN